MVDAGAWQAGMMLAEIECDEKDGLVCESRRKGSIAGNAKSKEEVKKTVDIGSKILRSERPLN